MQLNRLLYVSYALVIPGLLMTTPVFAENVVRWTSQGDALTLDPHSQNEGPTNGLNGQIYETLVARGPSLSLDPELAVSWSVEPDGWVFNLRKGVKFHDGADFTADDVVFSFERARHEASDFKKRVASVAEVKVIDEHTVKLVTKGANPILPNELTTVFIMDREWAEKHNVVNPQNFDSKEETYAVRNANGTGPFILTSRAPDEKTEMNANKEWWGKSVFPGNIDRIIYRPISNASTRVAAILSGEVDFVLDPAVQDVSRIESTEGLHVKRVAQNRSIFFGLNQTAEELLSSNIKGANPFKDVRVREAMNLAIDKKAIQRVVMDGMSFPTGSIIPPGVLGSTEDLDKSYGFNVENAKNLMKEAGYEEGFQVQLDCPNNRYVNDEKICLAAVAMLAKIGIKVNLEATPKSQHFPKIKKRTTDFYLLGWGVPTLDSHYVFTRLLQSDGSWNAGGYSNARVDELTNSIATETDLAAREEMIAEIWNTVRSEIPYIPIHHQVLAWGISDKIEMPISSDDQFRPRFAVMK